MAYATVQCISGTNHYTVSHIWCYSYVTFILLCSVYNEDTVSFIIMTVMTDS